MVKISTKFIWEVIAGFFVAALIPLLIHSIIILSASQNYMIDGSSFSEDITDAQLEQFAIYERDVKYAFTGEYSVELFKKEDSSIMKIDSKEGIGEWENGQETYTYYRNITNVQPLAEGHYFWRATVNAVYPPFNFRRKYLWDSNIFNVTAE